MCEQLQHATEFEARQPRIVARQVKEKFGGLRFYVQACADGQQGMIALAEAMSYRICDVCGARAELRGRPGDQPDALRDARRCTALTSPCR